MKSAGRRDWLLLVFAALSFAAVGLGAWVAMNHGVATGSWSRNVIAWAVGAAAAVGIARTVRPGVLSFIVWLAPLGLAATFLSPAQQGVHRWVDLGPLHINVAILLLPPAIVATAILTNERARGSLIALLAAAGLIVLQPDASQATTLAVAGVAIVGLALRNAAWRAGMAAAFVALAATAWLRPDPLQPVPEVEGIVGLAFSLAPLFGIAALALLAAIALVPVVVARTGTPASRHAGLALGLCFLMWAVTPFLGAFPVPFVGIGMSAVLGGWLGIGLLAGVLNQERQA